ncbi:hypothetical protein [Serinicoccus sp. LYQ131]|uniref:hypothetical protein n=1 Tax=Serinicoccus sp. LYQ131 TaxID=3378797 RepID=UPI0038529A98
MRAPGRGAAVALTMIMTLAACGSQEEQMGTEETTPATTGPPADEDTRTSAEPDAFSVSVDASATPATAPEGFTAGLEGVLVTYTVTNDGPEPIKVATDRGSGQTRSSVTASAAVWVSAGSSPDVARLSKQVFGIPDGVLPTDLHRVGSATVEPGGTLEDTAFVTLPLATDLPEGTRTITVTEDPLQDPAAVTGVEVCVQLAPGPEPGQEEPYASTIAANASGTTTVCSEVVELPEGTR